MVIFDASTIILLLKIDIFEVFILSFRGRALIPEAVMAEVCRKGDAEALLIDRLLKDKRLTIIKIKDSTSVKKLIEDFNIGIGEAEAITLALQEKADIVATDDRNAIRACKILKKDFITAIAILIRAYEKRLLDKDEAFAKLQKLEAVARYSKIIIEDARKRIKGGI